MVSPANESDLLDFTNEPEVFGKLLEGEDIIFSCHVYKKNRFFMKQKRNFCLTNARLLNLDGQKIKRSIEISKLKGLTKNIKNGNLDEFLIHVKDEYDYEIISEDRELILKLISEAYQEVSGGAELPVFGVNGNLGHYITTKKDSDAKTIKGLPPTEYKLEGEEAIKSDNMVWSESSKPKEK